MNSTILNKVDVALAISYNAGIASTGRSRGLAFLADVSATYARTEGRLVLLQANQRAPARVGASGGAIPGPLSDSVRQHGGERFELPRWCTGSSFLWGSKAQEGATAFKSSCAVRVRERKAG
jgi:hypothetical protein